MVKVNCRFLLALVVTGLSSVVVIAQGPQNQYPPSPVNPLGPNNVRRFPPRVVPTNTLPVQVVTPPPQTVLQTNTATVTAPTPDTNGIGAKIVFQTTIYDFGRVKSGDPVKYTYIFTNIGDKVLEIINVQPQCGCTAAGEFSRKVEPGQTGQIPIQFNTGNYGSQVTKTITVASNDKSQQMVVLQLKGTIWKPIELTPPYTILNVLPDALNTTGVVKIVNNMEQPLILTDPVCSNPSFIATLRTNTPGKEYQLALAPVPPLNPGTLQGKVTLKTSITNPPIVEVPFWANIQAPVMVLPAQIMIPATVTAKVSPSVTIQNNSTNALAISDPAVNLPGAEVQIRELQPGRIFSVQVSLPAGFEVPQGKKCLLTLKTSHPRFQTLEVPIVQMPKPLTPTQSALQQTFAPKTFTNHPLFKAQAPNQLLPATPAAISPTNRTTVVRSGQGGEKSLP